MHKIFGPSVVALACVVSAQSMLPVSAKSIEPSARAPQRIGADTFIYRKSGGFAAVNQIYEQNLGALPAPERQKLADLIKSSGLSKLTSDEKKTKGACDVFYYEFTLNENGQKHHALYDDTTLPESYFPLIHYLKNKFKDDAMPKAQK